MKNSKSNYQLIYICENDLSLQIGGTIHVKEILKSLNKIHPDIHLIAPKYSDAILKIPSNIPSIFIKTPGIRIVKWLYFYLVSTLKILRFIISSKKRCVIYSREMPYNLLLPSLSRLFNIPLIIELNGVFLREMKDLRYSHFAFTISKLMEKLVLSSAHRITTVSDNIAEEVSGLLKLSNNKFTVIPNGTNPDIFRPLNKKECRKKLNLSPNDFYVGFIGSCYPYHDIDTLLSIIPFLRSKVQNIKVLILGDGFMLNRWKKLARDIGIEDRVIFTGYVSFESSNIYINSFDICFASYKIGTSGFPMKILDYLACNKPIITSKIPTIIKYFCEDDFFKLVIPENHQDLINAVLELHSKKDKDIKKHRELVLFKYTWDHTVRRILNEVKKF